MKIALIGNMNNNLFVLTRYLKEKGYEVKLFRTFGEPEHFQPNADTFTLDFQQYTSSISWSKFPSTLYHTSKTEIAQTLKGFDFFIGSGVAPAYLNKIGKKLDIFIPYGADIYKFPFFKSYFGHQINAFPNIQMIKKMWKYYYFCKHQRMGVKNASAVLMDTISFEGKMKKFVKSNRLFLPCPLVYINEYSTENIAKYSPKLKFYPIAKGLRKTHDFLFLHQSRHIWKTRSNKIAIKGNDKLINGFANFLKKTKKKAHLILFEFGLDVNASKDLINELNIQQHVTWFPSMLRKEIMSIIDLIDLGIGNIESSYLIYGSVGEFMAMGKPLMHCRIDKDFKNNEWGLYPMIHANTVDLVEKGLLDFTRNPKSYKNMGSDARDWFMNYCINGPLNVMCDLIEKKEAFKLK